VKDDQNERAVVICSHSLRVKTVSGLGNPTASCWFAVAVVVLVAGAPRGVTVAWSTPVTTMAVYTSVHQFFFYNIQCGFTLHTSRSKLSATIFLSILPILLDIGVSSMSSERTRDSLDVPKGITYDEK
jgi:hypothetical protein